jgi:hypothetical protein
MGAADSSGVQKIGEMVLTDGHGVAVQNGYAFIASGNGGLVVVDVNDPGNPLIVYSDTTGVIQGVWADGNRLFAAVSMCGLDGLRIYDISNPTIPTLEWLISSVSRVYDVEERNGLLYILEDGVILVYDSSYFYLYGGVVVGGLISFSVGQEIIAAGRSLSSLLILRNNIGETLDLLSQFGNGGPIGGVCLLEDYSVLVSCNGFGAIGFFDVTDPMSPFSMDVWITHPNALPFQIEWDGAANLLVLTSHDVEIIGCQWSPFQVWEAGYYDLVGARGLDWDGDGAYIYVCTQSSLVILDWSGCTGTKEPGSMLPARIDVLGSFPNPFNLATTIRFSLQKTTFVRIEVYDALGRFVAMLVDGWRTAGIHEVTFNGSQFASGVYFYRIKAGEFLEHRKMVLMK